MEVKISQQKSITARMILHTAVPDSYAGCNLVLSQSDIPFQPDLITIENVAFTGTTNNQSYLVRSSLVNDDILFGFTGFTQIFAPRITIKPNKPLGNVSFAVSLFTNAGEVAPNTVAMPGLWLLSITMNFIELKK